MQSRNWATSTRISVVTCRYLGSMAPPSLFKTFASNPRLPPTKPTFPVPAAEVTKRFPATGFGFPDEALVVCPITAQDQGVRYSSTLKIAENRHRNIHEVTSKARDHRLDSPLQLGSFLDMRPSSRSSPPIHSKWATETKTKQHSRCSQRPRNNLRRLT